MLDVAALGNAPGSVILAIGAVSFEDSGVRNEFYINVDLDSCLAAGLSIDKRNLTWWLEESDLSREVLKSDGVPLDTALSMLTKAFDWRYCKVWCNGLDRQLPPLAHAYKLCNQREPWAYFNARDYPTAAEMYSADIRRELTSHTENPCHALLNARAHALTMVRLRNYRASCRGMHVNIAA